MISKRPVPKPGVIRGCESCDFRSGDFTKDTIDETIIRVYCKARHFNVDAEAMSKDCDFWLINPSYTAPVDEQKTYGL